MEEELTLSLSEINISGAVYGIKNEPKVRLYFENIEPMKVFLKGSTELTLVIPCDRCLKPTEVFLPLDFERELLSGTLKDELDDGDSEGYMEDEVFDLLSFLEEEILFNLPSKILCKSDCKGLCPVCGADRNIKDCGCDTFVPDPRMAGIADIFNSFNTNGKEV